MLPKLKILIPSILLLTMNVGCDDRATQIAREAADRQAQQNTSMADLNKEVASGAHRLVQADAQARQEIIGVHHDLQAERTRIDVGRNALEQERQQFAGERRTESLLAPAVALLGGLLLVSLLLGFCWYAVVAPSSSSSSDARLNELLIREFVVDCSVHSQSESGPALLDRIPSDR